MTKTSSDTFAPSANRAMYKWIAIGSALFAAALHAYLLKSHYDLRYGEVAGGLMCDISSKFSCSAASASQWSEIFHIPLALLGLLTNAALVTLALWDPIADENGRNSNRTGILLISGILVTASIVMAVISATLLDNLCPFCVGTYVLSVITAVSAWLAYRPGLNFEVKPALLGFAVAFGVSAFILNDQLRSSYTGPGGDAMAMAAVQEWSANPKLEIPETDPLAMGPSREKAKFTIAEFADFRCIHCKMAVAPIKAFAQSHPDVRVEYYSWPLDGECNTSITQANGASCLLARTVWCARSKAGKGWEAHEKVFERFDDWRTVESVRSSLESLAQQIGINADELKTCADSEEAKNAVTAQARLGSGLNIRGTPSIFVNGKLLPAGTSIPVLNAVYATFKD